MLPSSKTLVFRDVLHLAHCADDALPIKNRLYAAAASKPGTKLYADVESGTLKLGMDDEGSPENNDISFHRDEVLRQWVGEFLDISQTP